MVSQKALKPILSILFISLILIINALSKTNTSHRNQPVPNITSPAPITNISPSPTPQIDNQNNNETFNVVSITDGDTFKVHIDGKTETVRIVGINTPETVDPRKKPECFGREASDKLKSLLTGQKVELEIDKTQSNRDKYGRLLRFVKLDGKDVGLQMIQEGYAYESLYSSVPHKYYTQYVQAQKSAQSNKVGLWADGVCGDSPQPKSPN